jgi:HK97 family phage portal protein
MLLNPTEFVLLNPARLRMVYDTTNIISGYKYLQTNGQQKDINADCVVFLKLPDIFKPFRGIGKMRYISSTLDIDLYIEQYLKMFFFNDATPGSVLQSDKTLSKTAYERLKKMLSIKHQGYKNAHKNLILEDGLKWQQTSMKINELQLTDLNNLIRDKVLAAFKVPKSIVGIVEDVNRANGETSDRVFAKRCIKPLLRFIESQLNQMLLPKFKNANKFWLEFENPVKEDELLQMQVDSGYLTAGVWSINEVRARMELEPLDGGDTTSIQRTQANADRLAETIASNSGGNTPDQNAPKKYWNAKRLNKRFGIGKIEKVRKNRKELNAFQEMMKELIKPKKYKSTFSKEEKENFHKEKLIFTDRLERDYKEKLRHFFHTERNKVLGQITEKSIKKKDFVDDFYYDEESAADGMVEISMPFLEEAIAKESALAYSLVGLRGSLLTNQNQAVKDFLKTRTDFLGKSTSNTTKEAVEGILHDWAETGGSVGDLRSSLRDYFNGAESNRVDMIARTEISTATGFAQQEVYSETGAIAKEWVTAGDEITCEDCADLDGEQVDIDESFSDGEDAPPDHPDCRCDIVPIYYEEHRSVNNYKEKNLKRKEAKNKLSKKEKEIRKQELALIEKEANIVKQEEEIEKTITELEQIKNE